MLPARDAMVGNASEDTGWLYGPEGVGVGKGSDVWDSAARRGETSASCACRALQAGHPS